MRGGSVKTHADAFEQARVNMWHRGGTDETELSSRRLVVGRRHKRIFKCVWFLVIELLRALEKGHGHDGRSEVLARHPPCHSATDGRAECPCLLGGFIHDSQSKKEGDGDGRGPLTIQ